VSKKKTSVCCGSALALMRIRIHIQRFIKSCNLFLSLGHSLQGEYPALQNMKFMNFFLFQWVIFTPLNPDPSNQNQCECGSTTLPVLTLLSFLCTRERGESVFCTYCIADPRSNCIYSLVFTHSNVFFKHDHFEEGAILLF
jgi:hypothetical protein